jgi:hypothetical protein
MASPSLRRAPAPRVAGAPVVRPPPGSCSPGRDGGCAAFLGARASLEAARCELTTQTRALFGGGGAAGPPSLASPGVGDSGGGAWGLSGGGAPAPWSSPQAATGGPLPLLGTVPGGEAAEAMAQITAGLRAAARPWLRREAGEAAAALTATRAVGAVGTAWAPELPGGEVEEGREEEAAASAPVPDAWPPVVVVDARPPSVLPAFEAPSAAGAHPWPPAPSPAGAALAAAGAAAHSWRVVGQPRQLLVVSPPHSPPWPGGGGVAPGGTGAAWQRDGWARPGSVPLSTSVSAHW